MADPDAVNLIAPFALTRACLPLLKQAPDASVIFTGETHGHQPAPMGGYAWRSRAGNAHPHLDDELGAEQTLRINT